MGFFDILSWFLGWPASSTAVPKFPAAVTVERSGLACTLEPIGLAATVERTDLGRVTVERRSV